ncbi:MAG: hypothetical protein EA390_06125 [Balneolaceae bacterium]|nr:MAG: hypothetical protein EA390_06125 [Balneolaceae bacterium]
MSFEDIADLLSQKKKARLQMAAGLCLGVKKYLEGYCSASSRLMISARVQRSMIMCNGIEQIHVLIS